MYKKLEENAFIYNVRWLSVPPTKLLLCTIYYYSTHIYTSEGYNIIDDGRGGELAVNGPDEARGRMAGLWVLYGLYCRRRPVQLRASVQPTIRR